jgi:hypothetical protein
MSVRTLLIALLFCDAVCFCQKAGRSAADPKRCPETGKVVTYLEPVAPPPDLDQLVRMSGLIVDGTVIAVLPSINRNPDLAGAIETDSLVAIQLRLYGPLSPGTGTVAISQEGGKTTQCEEIIPDDPLLRAGERYILFLIPDTRKVPANNTGFPRYDVVGIWGGKVKVDNNAVQFSPKAVSGMHALNGTSVDAFLSQVKERISRLLLFEHP